MRNMRFLAEWEESEGVLLALPDEHTDWNHILEEALMQYRLLINAVCLNSDVKVLLVCKDRHMAEERLGEIAGYENLVLVETDYNDTWTRDYGPLCVENIGKGGELRLLDFGFNAWGLKFASDKDNLVNLRLSEQGIFSKASYRNNRDFTLEGGSVETDGHGTVLTTTRCLCSPNRNGGKSKEEAARMLQARLGADHVLWLDYGALEGDDTDSHIDTLARMAPDDTIIFTGCRDMDDPHFEELLKMRAQLEMLRTADGNRFNLVELPLPDPVYDPEDGSRLPATYSNYLVLNDTIFMPTYACPEKDILVCHTVKIAFPNHTVVPVDCRTLLRQHGSLHCATMQIPKGILNIV